MTTIQYKISEEVFKLFPDYCRGVLFIKKVRNRNSPAGLIDMIHEEENIIREKYSIETLTGDERINSWRNAYRKAGIKPADYRPSIEAMLRRVLKDQSIPSINAFVDIGNLFSLKYFIPIGCHSLHDIENDISLRLAEGTETFIPFGQNVPDNPAKGEIIFTDGNNVMTRRWTWRQSNHSITTLDSEYVEFNIDGLYPVTREIVENIGDEMIELINHFPGQNEYTMEIITGDKPCITLEY
jgi:DNA/RNA-binding domain of Phe-tRNA-synthetase-like protein